MESSRSVDRKWPPARRHPPPLRSDACSERRSLRSTSTTSDCLAPLSRSSSRPPMPPRPTDSVACSSSAGPKRVGRGSSRNSIAVASIRRRSTQCFSPTSTSTMPERRAASRGADRGSSSTRAACGISSIPRSSSQVRVGCTATGSIASTASRFRVRAIESKRSRTASRSDSARPSSARSRRRAMPSTITHGSSNTRAVASASPAMWRRWSCRARRSSRCRLRRPTSIRRHGTRRSRGSRRSDPIGCGSPTADRSTPQPGFSLRRVPAWPTNRRSSSRRPMPATIARRSIATERGCMNRRMPRTCRRPCGARSLVVPSLR